MRLPTTVTRLLLLVILFRSFLTTALEASKEEINMLRVISIESLP